MMMKAAWPLTLLGAAAWAMWRYDFSHASAAFARADWALVGAAFCLNIGMLYFRVFKWSLILRPAAVPGRTGPPFHPLCLAAFAGYTCNSILPARVGGLVQAWIAGRRTGLGFFPVMGTIALVRLLDGAALVVLGTGVAGAWALSSPGWTGLGPMGVRTAWAAGVILLAGGLFWGLVRFKGVEALITRLVPGLLPQKFRHRGRDAVSGFTRGLALLGQPGSLVLVAGLSLLFWLMAGTSVLLLLRAFDLGPGGFLPAFTLLLAQVLSLGIPAPASAGPYHGATVAVLSAFGVPVETGLLAAVAMHGVMALSNTLPGMVYVGIDGIPVTDLYKKMKKEELFD